MMDRCWAHLVQREVQGGERGIQGSPVGGGVNHDVRAVGFNGGGGLRGKGGRGQGDKMCWGGVDTEL